MEVSQSHGVASVLPEIARRLNFVVLRRLGSHGFTLLEEPPEWFHHIFSHDDKNPQSVDLASSSLFLDGFLIDAEDHWANERPEPLKSGVWHEFDQSDREHYLEATALYAGAQAVMILESLGHDYEVRVQLFKKARNFVLQNQSLDHELQKNDVLLHFLSTDLSPGHQQVSHVLAELKAQDLDHSAREKLNEAVRIAARQDILLDSFLRGFSSEIVTMQQVSRDYSSAPDVTEVVRTLVKAELENFLSRSVGLSLDSTIPPNQSAKVVGHRTRLEKVVGSLMHFALRRAPEGATIRLEVHSHGEDWILTELHESASSLGKEGESIFDNLLSADSLVRKAALSLYFCKLTIERWGGEIGYRHTGESGCWWFRLRRVKQSLPS
ncbi:MAG: hypothetical protein ACI9DF_002585 [Verrucomicrobiales bacterium]|jgi:hypothetical protein